jgi:hypothetical protein
VAGLIKVTVMARRLKEFHPLIFDLLAIHANLDRLLPFFNEEIP